jgi:hypothetical protein
MLPSPALEQPVEGGHAVDDRGSLLFRGLRERGGEWLRRDAGRSRSTHHLTGSASSMRTNRRSSGRALRPSSPRRSSRVTMPDTVLCARPIPRLSSESDSREPLSRISSTSTCSACTCEGVSGTG